MTVEDLQVRLGELHQQRERAYLTLHSVDGAIQEIEYWLRRLKEEAENESQRG